MQKIDKLEFLPDHETWNISDVLRLLCGAMETDEAISVIMCQHKQPLGELMETVANQGRFGRLRVHQEPGSRYDFHWDRQFLEEYNDKNYVEQTLEFILDLPVHPLRIIEWIDDTFEYNESSNTLSTESREFTLNTNTFKMLQEWRTHRDKGEIKDPIPDVSIEKLIKADLWVRTEVHVALFGETYSRRYPSFIYHHYKPNIENQLTTLDGYLEGAIATEKLKKYPHQGLKSLLIDNHGFDGYLEYKDHYSGVGIYTDNEIKGKSGVVPKDVLAILKFKGMPVPEGLVEAIDEGKWDKAEKLFLKLQESFIYFAEHGEAPADIKSRKEEQAFFPAPKDTEWSEIHFQLTEEVQVKIRIKNKEQLFSMNRLEKVFPKEPSRNLLLKALQYGGVFDRSIFDGGKQEHLKQYVSNLRRELKELFDISQNPIESAGNGNYKTTFQATSVLPPPDRDDW
jgi:hypothetical protein